MPGGASFCLAYVRRHVEVNLACGANGLCGVPCGATLLVICITWFYSVEFYLWNFACEVFACEACLVRLTLKYKRY